jgi:hypothetical protein
MHTHQEDSNAATPVSCWAQHWTGESRPSYRMSADESEVLASGFPERRLHCTDLSDREAISNIRYAKYASTCIAAVREFSGDGFHLV